MSSRFSKIATRVEMKNEIQWLKRAFRNAVAAYEQEQANGAELAKALWCAAKENGGVLCVSDATLLGMPDAAKLRASHNEDTGVTTFVAHVEEHELPPVPAPRVEGQEAPSVGA